MSSIVYTPHFPNTLERTLQVQDVYYKSNTFFIKCNTSVTSVYFFSIKILSCTAHFCMYVNIGYGILC